MSNQNAVLRSKAVDYAYMEVGTRPLGKSRTWGSRIKEYQESVGLTNGYNYCGAFVNWCFEQAAQEMGRPNPLDMYSGGKHPRHVARSATSLYNFAKGHGLLVERPEEGDIFISSKGDLHHIGLVAFTPDRGDTTLKTIEGNTWVGDTHWGVWAKTNKPIDACYYVRV
jgi:hypothetical protein